jgi:hypothetical protein
MIPPLLSEDVWSSEELTHERFALEFEKLIII